MTNTLNSGWDAIFNWGVRTEGEHAVYVEIQNTQGVFFTSLQKTIMVIKYGGFEYLSTFSLAGAAARTENNIIVLDGVVVAGEADGALRQQEVNLQYAWSPRAQQLAPVKAETVENVASTGQPVWLDRPTLVHCVLGGL